MGKSKWDFKDCFWVNNGLYTTVEGHVKMCCFKYMPNHLVICLKTQ